MRRHAALLLMLLLMLTGCASAPPESHTPTLPSVRVTGWHAGGGPSFSVEELLENTPTYIGDRSWSGPYPLSGTELKRPFLGDGKVDPPSLLPRLAATLEATGEPEVPEGIPATFAGVLDGGYYVYAFGGYPPNGDDGGLVYSLHKDSDGWTASKLCRGAWRWVWGGTQNQTHDPVVVCASIEGSGAMLNLLAYAGDQQVLWFGGLADGALDVKPDPAGGPPVIVVDGETKWLDWKGEPGVRERYTFAFQDGAYALVAHERLEDWNYHLARLRAFLRRGKPEQAASEFASPPPGGVQAYIEQAAPGFLQAVPGRLHAETAGAGRVRLWPADSPSGPGFVVEVDERGRVLSISGE